MKLFKRVEEPYGAKFTEHFKKLDAVRSNKQEMFKILDEMMKITLRDLLKTRSKEEIYDKLLHEAESVGLSEEAFKKDFDRHMKEIEEGR